MATSKPVTDQDKTTLACDYGNKDRTMWTSPVEPGVTVSVTVNDETLEIVTSNRRVYQLGSGFRNLKFHPEPSKATKKVLEEELENCNQLLELGKT